MVFLIVDSSDIIKERLVFLISESGSTNKYIHCAGSYDDAALLFEETKPDVVLLDMYLPGHKSVDFFKMVKKSNNPVSLIVFVNHADHVTREHYEWVGADFVFDKYKDFEKIPLAVNAIAARLAGSQ
ncbi:MAG TPA: response regulator [Ferruginibacter sp.]|nr:response regulator [Ferruginibacter sp.]HMP21912.1 response regulator [Ferruginibacter sp.]